MGTRWHPEHPLWVKWQKEKKAGKAFDTRDGTKNGVKNDAFDAYSKDGVKGEKAL
jgi:hypothetical protein